MLGRTGGKEFIINFVHPILKNDNINAKSGLHFIFEATIDGIGAVIGADTIITAYFTGLRLDFFKNKLASPILYGKDVAA